MPRTYSILKLGWLTGCCCSLLVLILVSVGCSNKSEPTKIDGPPAISNPVPVAVAGPTIFEDVTAASRVNFTYRNGEEANNYAIIESLGGGVALFDFDNDGLLDIFLPGGGYFDGTTVKGHPGKLYRNLGGFKFEDVTEKVGLGQPLQYSHGASAFDYDNDGWLDLAVSGYNRLILFHNESNGKGGRKFVDITAKAGLNDNLWSTSTAWGDLNGDGIPDLYVCHYGNWGFSGNGPDGKPYRNPLDCTYHDGVRDVCQPAKFTQLPHTVYINNGDGTFTDVSQKFVRRTDPKSKVATIGGVRVDGRGIGVAIVDVNNDGIPDIYTANDTDENFLYMNRGGKYGKGAQVITEEIGMMAGVARDDRGTANGSMGIAVGDYNRTGLSSILVTNYESELPALYENRTVEATRPRFTYSTQAAGLGVLNGVYVSWGTCFADLDWNGWEDLLIVNGHAIRHPHKTDRKQMPVLMKNEKARFSLITAQGGSYFSVPHNARGTAYGDLDNDGRIDLVISGLNEPVAVLKNIAPTEGKHWIGLSLKGKTPRDLVGSRVVIETASGKQTRFVKGGGSYGSTEDPRLHFGLAGDNEIRKCTVYWSYGAPEVITGVKVDGYSTIQEGSAKAVPVPSK